ncbi:Acyltransferase, partial [Ancylostoma caninum]
FLIWTRSPLPCKSVVCSVAITSYIFPRVYYYNIYLIFHLSFTIDYCEVTFLLQLKLYGDIEQLRQKPESALVLANHQSDVDWAVIVMLAQRQGAEGSDAGFRVMVKHVIHYVPLFGWYIFQHGYIYVRRFGEFLSAPVLKQLAWLDTIDEKFWLLVFPEGTRYSLKRKENILVSQEFCRRKGIPEFKNVLSPRAGGAFMALENLESLDAVYDVTIAYGQTRLPNRRGLAPNMFEFCCGSPAAKTLSVHVKRYPAEQLHKNSRKELQDWIIQAYYEKDKYVLATKSSSKSSFCILSSKISFLSS